MRARRRDSAGLQRVAQRACYHQLARSSMHFRQAQVWAGRACGFRRGQGAGYADCASASHLGLGVAYELYDACSRRAHGCAALHPTVAQGVSASRIKTEMCLWRALLPQPCTRAPSARWPAACVAWARAGAALGERRRGAGHAGARAGAGDHRRAGALPGRHPSGGPATRAQAMSTVAALVGVAAGPRILCHQSPLLACQALGRAPSVSAAPWLPPGSVNQELTPRCRLSHRRRTVTQLGAPGTGAPRPGPDARAGRARRAAEPVPQDGLAGRAAVPAGGLAALREQRRRAHHARARPLAQGPGAALISTLTLALARLPSICQRGRKRISMKMRHECA